MARRAVSWPEGGPGGVGAPPGPGEPPLSDCKDFQERPMPTMTPAPSTAAPAPGPACAGDPDLMFPLVESERAWRPTPGEAAAQAVCARCPVLAQCRRDVLTGEPAPYGVAGGLTVADRRAIRASRRGLDLNPTTAAAGA